MAFWRRLRKPLQTTELSARLAWVGLDHAGKTSIVHYLKTGEIADHEPTVGANIERIFDEKDHKIELVIWDLGGQQVRRQTMWKSYLENLNELALEALLDYSKTWSPSIRFNLAEAIIESKIERSLEIYCKIFIGMELVELAHCMSGKLEYTESTDLNPEMYQQFRDKMAEMEKYDNKIKEELKGSGGRIIQLKNKRKNFG